MSKTLVANWKANPQSLSDAQKLFAAEQNSNVIICPPAAYLFPLSTIGLDQVAKLGAQDVFWEAGAHTGQHSVEMLRQFEVSHVLVGHSERRALGETDEQINRKVKALLAAGLTPILLIGETEKGPARSDFLIDQLTRDLENINTEDAKKILYCYEPVWAISSNAGAVPATPDDVISAIHEMQDILEKMHGFRPAMFYGGSVNVGNLADFFQHDEISGAVVGGASLKADEFKKMIEII